jgi:hypothetical protein
MRLHEALADLRSLEGRGELGEAQVRPALNALRAAAASIEEKAARNRVDMTTEINALRAASDVLAEGYSGAFEGTGTNRTGFLREPTRKGQGSANAPNSPNRRNLTPEGPDAETREDLQDLGVDSQGVGNGVPGNQPSFQPEPTEEASRREGPGEARPPGGKTAVEQGETGGRDRTGEDATLHTEATGEAIPSQRGPGPDSESAEAAKADPTGQTSRSGDAEGEVPAEEIPNLPNAGAAGPAGPAENPATTPNATPPKNPNTADPTVEATDGPTDAQASTRTTRRR